MAESKKHIQEIDALKGWAIFSVVLGHAIIVYPIDLHANYYCSVLFAFFSSFHVRLFFLVSGFCFSFRGDYLEYIKKKVFRLLIPYYSFCMIEMIAKLVFSGQINRPRSMGEFITRMLFYGGDYWFLWTLFMMFLFSPLLYRLLKRGVGWEIGCLLAVLVISLITVKIDLFCIEDLAKFYFWFVAGVVFRMHWNSKRLTGPASLYILAVLILTAAQLFLICERPFPYSVRVFFCGNIGVILSILLARFSCFNAAFSRFGKYSLQLYLLNGVLLGISRIVICNFLGVTVPAVIIAFNMLIDFFLSYLLIKYVLSKIPFVRTLMGMV